MSIIRSSSEIVAAKAARRRRQGDFGLQQLEGDDAMIADAEEHSGEEDGGAQRSRRKRRRRDAGGEQPQPDAPAGDKDHLFFSLMPSTDDAAAPSTVLCAAYGSACTLYPDSAAATAIHAESHLLALTMRSLASMADEDDGQRKSVVIRLDRHDVRLLVDQAEWIPPRGEQEEDEERDEWIDTTEDEMLETSYSQQHSADDLLREKMTASEWRAVQQERYQDLDPNRDASSHQDQDAEMEDASKSASSSDVEGSSEAKEQLAELDEETIAEEIDKRRKMESAGQTFQFKYEDAAAPATPTPAAATNTPAAGVKRPPPPPPRRQPAPPPPRPAAATSIDATVQSVAPAPVEAPFKPPFAVPGDIRLPLTLADHRVIAHTVKYIHSLGAQGGQQEILLKLKQRNNERFYFMNWDHPLHPFYTWLKQHPQHAEESTPVAKAESKTSESMSALVASSTPITAKAPPPPPPGVKAPPGVAKKQPASPIESLPSLIAAPDPETSSDALAGLLGGYGDDDDDEPTPAAPPPPLDAEAAPSVSHLSIIPLPASALALLPPPPEPLPPLDVLTTIHTISTQLQQKGSAFGMLLRAKERNNVKYAFLKEASPHHAYFAWLAAAQATIAAGSKASSQPPPWSK